LPLADDFNALKTSGPGTIQIDHHITISSVGSILLKTPASLSVKNPTNRSYASAEMIRPLKGEDLRGFNRFSVWVYADAPGFYSVFVGCTLYNGGKHVMWICRLNWFFVIFGEVMTKSKHLKLSS